MYEIMGERLVRILDTLNADATEKVEKGVIELTEKDPVRPIQLIITSPGGPVPLGFRLYDFLRIIRRPELHTIVFGEANSMAVLVFLAGDRRLMSLGATLNLHRFIHHTENDYNGEELKAMGEGLLAAEQQYAEIIARRSGGKITPRRVREMMRREIKLSAGQALKFGLAHEILEE